MVAGVPGMGEEERDSSRGLECRSRRKGVRRDVEGAERDGLTVG